jgi:hypothetical protein
MQGRSPKAELRRGHTDRPRRLLGIAVREQAGEGFLLFAPEFYAGA